MGEHWEAATGHPIPLGAIVAKRSLGGEALRGLADAARRSVRRAWASPSEPLPYVREHAQEMDAEVVRRHIELYVNAYTEDLGPGGYEAVRALLGRAAAHGLVPEVPAGALDLP